MAYDSTELTQISVGNTENGPNIWRLYTTDNKATAGADDYMVSDPQKLAVGDWVLATCSDGPLLLVATTASNSVCATTSLTPA